VERKQRRNDSPFCNSSVYKIKKGPTVLSTLFYLQQGVSLFKISAKSSYFSQQQKITIYITGA
jgi:hypothetical protein